MRNFIVGTELIRDNAISDILDLPLDYSYEVIIRKAKSKRSLSQNNLMWMWEKIFADYAGYQVTTKDQKEDFHEAMLLRMYGAIRIFKKIKGKTYVQDRPKKRTKNMSVEDMTEHLKAMEAMAIDVGLILPYPDDYKFAMEGKRK